MAGIGFQLKKLLSERNYTGTLKAYAYSSLIVSGPLLITILCVTLLNWISIDSLTILEQEYLRILIMYAFALSLIAVGPLYLVLTRYIADEYYREHLSSFSAVFFSSVTVQLLITAPIILYYYWDLSLPWSIKLSAVLLYLEISTVWIAMIFLSAAQDYMRIVHSFFWGAFATGVSIYFYGQYHGLLGYYNCFVIGQGVLCILLCIAILKEFGYREPRDYYWLSYLKKYPILLAIGFFYNLGIWIDKFIFWASYEGVSLDVRIRHCPVYDGPMFVAFMTSVPSLAYFMIQMETDFFVKYRSYFQAVQSKENLDMLEERRVRMVDSLEEGLKRLFIFQGFVTGLAILLVPWMAKIARMDYLQMGVLRTGILASFLQVAYLIIGNILLYFDFQKYALICSIIFCVGNGLFTYLSIRFGLPAYGFGYALACFVAFAVSFFILNVQLKKLHYWTYMRQPLPKIIPTVEDE